MILPGPKGLRRLLGAVLAASAVLVLGVGPAGAHPIDAYLHASYVTVTPRGVSVEVDISPGVKVAHAVLKTLDTDDDGVLSTQEGQAYAARLAANLTVRVDGEGVPSHVVSVRLPNYEAAAAGYGVIRVVVDAHHPMTPGRHTIDYRNATTGQGVVYQANAFLDHAVRATIGKQTRSADQARLRFPVTITSGARPGSGSSGFAVLLGILGTGAVVALCWLGLRRRLLARPVLADGTTRAQSPHRTGGDRR